MKEIKISVCFIMPKAYPVFNPEIKATFGGSEVDLYYISTELAKDADYKVQFIVADYGQPKTEIRENVKIIKSLKPNSHSPMAVFKLWSAMKKANSDIYLIKTPTIGTFLCCVFCKLKNKKFIYRSSNERQCNGQFQKENLIKSLFFNWSLKKSDCVLVQNRNDAENLEKYLNIKSMVIPNAHRKVKSDTDNKDSILWVGRSEKVKNPYAFLELAEKMPDQKFIMICPPATNDNNYSKLKEKADEITNLDFIKRVSYPEIISFFQKAKLFINTSFTEGFPNTFIEACQTSTPVISLNINPDDFLTKYSCGIYCHGDLQKVHKAILFLISSDRYLELGKNAEKYINDHHNIDNIISDYKNCFDEILKT